MQLRVLSWNLFHGRDFPPEPELLTWRSRLLRVSERGRRHAQVNRDLREHFTSLLAGAAWDVALLQECPPRWAERLASDCGAVPHLVLTSRNLPGPLGRLQAGVADRNPDLIASWEGGSNLTLVRTQRVDQPGILERRSLRLALRPERRVMAFSRLESGVCVANLHASGDRAAAERELLRAAAVAGEWAGDAPLVLGGDFNLRPALSRSLFDALARYHGLAPPTGERVIDHLLARGLAILARPTPWPPERREVPDPTAAGPDRLPIRLSDHAPVEALFDLDRSPQGGAR